ncbi:MAG: hypothetical protein HYZ28_11665 [Myxococcales bacterium]|nr:hypothetical protein [Myxococcales bacterium]
MRSGRYDLLMAIDHLLEGAQLYGKAAQDAAGAGDSEAAEFFGSLERGSRRQAQVARELLERPMPQRAQVHAAVGS